MKVGDKIIGFKFDNFESHSFTQPMEELIGQEGTIVRLGEHIVSVQFSTQSTYGYPKEMAKGYVVGEKKELFPFY